MRLVGKNVERLAEELAELRPAPETVVTIGVFDGVHLGHQHVVRRTVERARKTGRAPVGITFYPHPLQVHRPEAAPKLIIPFAERVRLLESLGLVRVVPMAYSPELARLSAAEYLSLLVEALGMRELVVGPDFTVGRNREGTVPVLARLGSELGFTLTVVDLLALEARVSSSTIRALISAGEVEQAAVLLGRPVTVWGRVVAGAGRGRQLGFPTANLSTEPEVLLPADGVYAAWAEVRAVRYPAAVSIGVRPTFGPGPRLVEAYLLDFAGNIYGENVKLELIKWLRPELAFSTAAALIEQMRRDAEQVRELLTERVTDDGSTGPNPSA
jgi:riboflavin kinase/FMN adenylyltransferase